MNSRLLLLLVLIFLPACMSEEDRLRYEKLRNDLIGQWHMIDIPAAEETWQFKDDGTYMVQMGQTQDHGTWELKKDVLYLDGDDSSKEIIIIENGQLNWGNYHFKKTGDNSASNPNLRSDLIGSWELDDESRSSVYQFFPDGTYELMSGQGGSTVLYAGNWEINQSSLVLDGQQSSAKDIQIKDNTLFWKNSSYSKLNRSPLKGEKLATELLGSWYTDEVGNGITYTFKEDGQFSSFDGRYTAEGSWKISGTELIIDDYMNAAEAIRIANGLLRWDGHTFIRLNRDQLPNWQFEQSGGEIRASNPGGQLNRIVAKNQTNVNQLVQYKISASVGPFVVLLKTVQPTAQVARSYYEVYNAASNQQVNLTQLFSEGELLYAFQQNKEVSDRLQSEPQSLSDLVNQLGDSCNFPAASYLLRSFTFYRLRSTSVEIQIELPAICKSQNKASSTNIRLRLPIPVVLEEALKTAQRQDKLANS